VFAVTSPDGVLLGVRETRLEADRLVVKHALDQVAAEIGERTGDCPAVVDVVPDELLAMFCAQDPSDLSLLMGAECAECMRERLQGYRVEEIA
jgi:hypothetical protein